MDDELIEVGVWSGSAAYPKAAVLFLRHTYPQPKELEHAKVSPASSRWESAIGEFLFDYGDPRKSKDPDGDLL